MIYVYAPAFESVFLYLYLKEKYCDSIHIITRNNNIAKYCKEINQPYTLLNSYTLNVKRVSDFFKLKKETKGFLDTIKKGSSLYTMVSGFDTSGLFLVKEWKKLTGNVYYPDIYLNNDNYRFSIKDILNFSRLHFLISFLIVRFYLNLKINVLNISNMLVTGIDKSFFLQVQY